ncbi:transposase [Acidobacteriota bacterium]
MVKVARPVLRGGRRSNPLVLPDNRGYDGNAIFSGTVTKSHFLDYIEDAVTKMKMRIFAYCIMDNHYHMVLENTSGKMSDFMKLLNGNFGMYYRKKFGGQG